MENVLPRTQDVIQEEILTLNGYQKCQKLTVRDFGNNNVEFSLMPYETWSEVTEEDLDHPVTDRGEGDRERSAESAANRAKRKVRHLCKLLKARYMVTLTTKELITDLDIMQKYFQEFVRRVRKVHSFEYVAVHELQKRGALHLHIAVANRQDFKLLWSIWHRVVGKDKGRVFVSSGNRKASINQIAGYMSKYMAKDFLDGNFNRRRYWASRNIGEVIKAVHFLRDDWSFNEVFLYIGELCKLYQVKFDITNGRVWHTNINKGLFWMEASG